MAENQTGPFNRGDLVIALHQFVSRKRNDLWLMPGDVVRVISPVAGSEGFWRGELNYKVGLFPESVVKRYIEQRDRANERLMLVTSEYDAVHHKKVPHGSKDHFHLKPGHIVRVIYQVDDNFLLGESFDGDKRQVGMFRAACARPYELQIGSMVALRRFSAKGSDQAVLEPGQIVNVTNFESDWCTFEVNGQVCTCPGNYLAQYDLRQEQFVRVTQHYTRKDEGSVSLRPGQIIRVLSRADNTCWYGLTNGRVAHFIPNCATPYHMKTEEAIAVQEYIAQNNNELSLQLQQRVHVRNCDGALWQGEVNGVTGFFPASCVAPHQPERMQQLVDLAMNGEYLNLLELASPELLQARDETGRTVLMQLADSERDPGANAKCIEHLMHLGTDPAAVDWEGNSAAHFAAKRNHVRLLALLPFGPKVAANERGVTPLMEAARTGSWACAAHLLHLMRETRHNESSNQLRLKILQAQRARDIAQGNGHNELARLIEIEATLSVDPDGKLRGLPEAESNTMRELIRLIQAPTPDTADVARIQQLVTRLNCDLPDPDGTTAAMFAISRGDQFGNKVLRLLLECGADAACADVQGLSGLHHAAKAVNAEAAIALIGAGAPVNGRCDTANTDMTPLLLLVRQPSGDALNVAEALLSAGADWSLKDRWGRTALKVACKHGRTEVYNFLLPYESREFFSAAVGDLRL